MSVCTVYQGKNLREAKLEKIGIKSSAEVVEVVTVFPNDEGVVGLKLRLRNGKFLKLTECFDNFAMLRVGDVVQVVYDPARPEDVILAKKKRNKWFDLL